MGSEPGVRSPVFDPRRYACLEILNESFLADDARHAHQCVVIFASFDCNQNR